MNVKMRHVLQTAHFLLTLLVTMESKSTQHYHHPISQQLKNRPIIAVLAQHQHQLLPNQSYIPASYIKYLEASGARVVPIPRHFTNDQLQQFFTYVNGALLPGGAEYYESAKLFLDMAIQANDRGDFFPIWGTCFGFQALHIGVVGMLNDTILSKCPSVDKALPLNFVEGIAAESRLLKNVSPEMYRILSEEKVTYNHHNYGVTRDTYKKFPKLNEFFKILSVNTDETGKEFISTVEARRYPIYGVQWHPEKNNFEYTRAFNEIPHSKNGILTSQYMANFFVNEARKNHHKFPTEEMEDKHLIYNFNPIHSAKLFDGSLSHFEQIYLFEG